MKTIIAQLATFEKRHFLQYKCFDNYKHTKDTVKILIAQLSILMNNMQ